jgi:cell division protease FtsH
MEGEFTERGVPTHALDHSAGVFARTIARLVRLTRSCDAAILHAHGPAACRYARVAARMTGAACLLHLHALHSNFGRARALRWWVRWALDKLTAAGDGALWRPWFVACSGSVLSSHRSYLGATRRRILLASNGVEVNPDPQGQSVLMTLLTNVLPLLLIFGFVFFLMNQAQGGGSRVMSFGRAKPRLVTKEMPKTTFEDVAGLDEAVEEIIEIKEYLANPARFQAMGAKIPRGVLLFGPPGTGKTLLARAVAGEAGVPFFSISGSDFVEMFVGVGASRVRDLFKQAKEAAPAIIFIDELDAIGRSRGGGVMGGHEEREQTLNQILTEMDGFSGAEGVIVLAATNRPEILDVALLRPGRFDRRVAVNPPDQAGRLAILKVHTRHMPLADDVDLEGIASSSPGMVGADLKNLANEAAIMGARRNHERVQLSDFTDALEKILLGAERKIMLSKEERERTAYHESGHALLGMLEPGADPVRKISIIPRGRALGVTFQSPSADRYGYDAAYLRGRIEGALGGRAAEQIVYGNVTTGAESDLEQVTRIAKQMVGRWGMSEVIGPVSILPGPNDEPFLLPGTGPGGPSAHTLELVDSEVRKIIDACYTEALAKLTAHRDKPAALTHALLERETLDEADAYAVAGVPRQPRPDLLSDGIPAPTVPIVTRSGAPPTG